MSFRSFVTAAICLTVFLMFAKMSEAEKGRNKVVLVLVDGFANWVLDRSKVKLDLPGLKQMQKNGVRARNLQPPYPSVSPTAYWSILTGLYPEKHGLVGSYVYDREQEKYWQVYGRPFFYTEEPMAEGWGFMNKKTIVDEVTEKGIGVAGYWLGSCEISKGHPDRFKCVPLRKYEDAEKVFDRMPEILEDIANPDIQFVSIGNAMVDYHSHLYGPKAPETMDKIKKTDDMLKLLQEGIEEKGLTDNVNLIVVSDHGMVPIKENIFLDDYINISLIAKTVDAGPWVMVYPEEGKGPQLYDELLLSGPPHIQVYWKYQLPDRWHLKDAQYLSPMIIAADSGYGIFCKSCASMYPPDNSHILAMKAGHGYDNQDKDMQAIFFARGPDFKTKHRHNSLEMVDIFGIICHVLRIDCDQNDGDWDRIVNMFVSTNRNYFAHEEL